VFQTDDTNLVNSVDVITDGVPGPTTQIVMADVVSCGRTLISVMAGGAYNEGANGDSTNPRISGNGRYVVFESVATNLTSDGVGGLFVRDVLSGTTQLVSRLLDGSPAANCYLPAIDSTGSNLAFETNNAGFGVTNWNILYLQR